jgi:hypothetical protein
MFTQDVQLGVMPIGGRSLKPQVSAVVDGSMGALARELLSGFEDGYHGHSDLEVICDAVNSIAAQLAYYGRAAYELVDVDGHLNPISITTAGLVRIFGNVYQLVPLRDRRVWWHIVNSVNARRIWRISMPVRLGGYLGYRITLYGLGQARITGPEFFSTDLSAGRWDPAFDFSQYRKSSENALKRLTREWGWNRRETNLERQTEFYLVYKTLRFKLAQAILREHIVSELNALFGRIGWQASIVLSGVPAATDIERVESQMLDGTLPYSKVYDLITA